MCSLLVEVAEVVRASTTDAAAEREAEVVLTLIRCTQFQSSPIQLLSAQEEPVAQIQTSQEAAAVTRSSIQLPPTVEVVEDRIGKVLQAEAPAEVVMLQEAAAGRELSARGMRVAQKRAEIQELAAAERHKLGK